MNLEKKLTRVREELKKIKNDDIRIVRENLQEITKKYTCFEDITIYRRNFGLQTQIAAASKSELNGYLPKYNSIIEDTLMKAEKNSSYYDIAFAADDKRKDPEPEILTGTRIGWMLTVPCCTEKVVGGIQFFNYKGKKAKPTPQDMIVAFHIADYMSHYLHEEEETKERYFELHELKNKMAIIKGALETATLMKEGKEIFDILDMASESIDECTNSLEKILQRRSSRYEKEEMEMKKLIAEIAGRARYMIKAYHCDISLETSSEDGKIYVPYNAVISAAMNMIKNACEAFDERKIEKGTIEIRGIKEKSQIEIKDDAGGIPSGLDVFSKSTKGAGRGIGLSLAKKQLEALGCGVDYETWEKEGKKGSIFRIRI